MVAAALMVLVTGVGVGFGWQPMPGDSPRSEYLVQIEPEMLEALARGAEIPIVSDVPADAGPIGRVRLVVGRGKLPHGQTETRLKPAADDGVVLTQYTEPPAMRYGTPAPVAAAPSATAPPAYDAFTGVPATGAAPAGAGGGSWNSEVTPVVTQPAAPAGSGWNGGAAPTAEVTPTGVLPRFRAGVQEATEPLRNGIDNVGGGMRTAAQNIRGRTDRLIDELTGAEPPAVAPVTATQGQGWNGGATVPPVAGSPAAAGGVGAATGGWNNPVPATGGVGSAPPYAPYTPDYGSTAPPYVPSTPATGAPNTGSWADATSQPPAGASAADNGGTTTTSIWPGSEPAAPTVLQPPPLASPPAPGTTTTGPPAIDAGMLSLPGNRALDGIGTALGNATLPAAPGAVGGPPITGVGTVGTGSLPGSAGWASGFATPAATPTTVSTTPSPATEKSASQQAAVLFAWVTLVASAAGNIYLFWSYLDVRTKYRALVRKTARAVGSRFSPA